MNTLIKNILLKNTPVVQRVAVANKSIWFSGAAHPTKGKHFKSKKTIKQVLQDREEKDESIHYIVNIGLPFEPYVRNKEQKRRNELLKRNLADRNLARLVRSNELDVPLEETYDEWIRTEGPTHLRRIAEHYGIFEHLFGDAYFYPVTPLAISYKCSDEKYTPVYFGNIVKPKEAQEAPIVDIDGKSDVFYTLVLSNLDGHLNKENGEYVHWLVGNIPDGDVTKGETVCSYLQPFPTKGTGYHRYAFVLYEHPTKLDFTSLRKEIPTDPSNRDFSSYDFYRERQDYMTPSGLLFYQTDWDSSVPTVFHKTFDMEEPRFEYDFPEPYLSPQTWFPKKKPFNTYMDCYRDPKQISKEVLTKKLKTHHPFEPPEPPLEFPALHTKHDHGDKALWVQVEVKKERLKWGKIYNDNVDILEPR